MGNLEKNEGCGETHEEISRRRGQETEEETEPPPDIIAPLTLYKNKYKIFHLPIMNILMIQKVQFKHCHKHDINVMNMLHAF